MAKRYYNSERHTIQVTLFSYFVPSCNGLYSWAIFNLLKEIYSVFINKRTIVLVSTLCSVYSSCIYVHESGAYSDRDIICTTY